MTDTRTEAKHQDNCITSVPIFKSLSEEETSEVLEITHSRVFAKGEAVYRQGDAGGKLYVLHKGHVRISRLNSSGKEQVIRVVGPGEFIGELALFSNKPNSDHAVVTAKATMCIIDGQDLKQLMAKHPGIAFKVLDELSRRLDMAETMIETISLDSVEQRLANALLAMKNEQDTVRLQMTRGDFASQLGMSQETLSRKLSAFEDAGLISQISSREIQLSDADKLRDLSQ